MEEELKPLEDKLREYRSCLEDGRPEDLNKINTEFHDMLYALSRSPNTQPPGEVKGTRPTGGVVVAQGPADEASLRTYSPLRHKRLTRGRHHT